MTGQEIREAKARHCLGYRVLGNVSGERWTLLALLCSWTRCGRKPTPGLLRRPPVIFVVLQLGPETTERCGILNTVPSKGKIVAADVTRKMFVCSRT